MDFNKLLAVAFTLFAVIDIIGSIPIRISLKERLGNIHSLRVTLVSGIFMIVFLLAGEQFLKVLNLDVRSFAVGGSIVMLLIELEMVPRMEISKEFS